MRARCWTGSAALPEPQRVALSVAFGLSAGEPPDRFLVALAALSLLSDVAEERPLLCVVDDAQWLDSASAQVLGFVARRLLAESVAMVFAVREPSEEPELAGLPELRVGGLDDEDARALLARVIPGRLDERVRDRLVAETRGNPLALLELPRGMSAAELAGGFALPDAVGLPGRIQDHYVRRVGALPETTQRLMLLAAADPVGDATTPLARRADTRTSTGGQRKSPIRRAVAGDRAAGCGSAIRWSDRRSTGPRRPADRKLVHGALAAATDAGTDPDRRAWHRAHATSAPDEAVAGELIECADGAQRRGGIAAAAAFLERAVMFTPDPAQRASRALDAARAKFETGDFAQRSHCSPAPKPDRSTSSVRRRCSACARRSPSICDAAGTLRGCCCARPSDSSRSTPNSPGRPIWRHWSPRSTPAVSPPDRT